MDQSHDCDSTGVIKSWVVSAVRYLILMIGVVVVLAAMADSLLGQVMMWVEQSICSRTTDIMQTLDKKYRETRRGVGIDKNTHSGGPIVELFYNETKPSWTILLTFPNGTSCLLRSGTEWLVQQHVHKPGTPEHHGGGAPL